MKQTAMSYVICNIYVSSCCTYFFIKVRVYNIKGCPHLLKNFLKEVKTGVINGCDIRRKG